MSSEQLAEKMKEAIKRRGNIKGKLTRFSSFFTVFLKNENKNYTELKLRLDKLETLYEEFDVIQTEIEDIDDSEEHQSERVTFENNFFAIQAAAADEYGNHRSNISLTANQNRRQEDDNQLFQLPRINLPEFSGGYQNWQSFRDNFMVIVHNKNIASVQKLQYLRLSLKGPAAQLIDCLSVTEANYKVAWDLLCERYENKRLIVQTHLSQLFSVSKLEQESGTELRNLYDVFTRHLGALRAVGEVVDGWSTILVFLAASKLDAKSLMEWETSRKDTKVPTWIEFETFLSHRCHALAAIEFSNPQLKIITNRSPVQHSRRSLTTFYDKGTEDGRKCYICKVGHALYQCPKFLALRTPDKVKTARAANICLNCLRRGHRASTCRSSGCQKCNKRHNSKLHLEEEEREEAFSNNFILDQEAVNEINPDNILETEESSIVGNTQICNASYNNKKEVAMLSTALVIINDVRGKKIRARVLLHSGSQVNLITVKLATKLGYPITKTNVTIRGVSGDPCKPVGELEATVKSRINAFEVRLKFFVMQNVAGTFPSVQPGEEIMNAIKLTEYADPEVYSPRKVDMIMGTQVFFRLLCIGQIRPAGTYAIWQKTVFGWVLAGHIKSQNSMQCLSIMDNDTDSIHDQVKTFWEIEEVVKLSVAQTFSKEEKKCEAHYINTYHRTNDGRFRLKLPFRENVKQLGESRDMAEKRFYSLERKLEANLELKEEYIKFMTEYRKLGHMILKTNKTADNNEQQQIFLPHHAVVKQESSTTKVRVVFDASSKTTTSISLNDTLMIGPTIQDDLRAILMRFRVHEVVITADIEKMYRQIAISPECQSYQQILWRENSNDPLETYQLQTVTYGTSAAPFMVIRTLHQLAECEKENYDQASRIAKRDFYVDDLLTGTTCIEKAVELQDSMVKMCRKGGFILRKWCSNRDELLDRIPNDMRATSHNFNFKEALGVRWKPRDDKLHYMVQVIKPLTTCTKRKVVSEMAKIFNPLGLIGPISVKAKIFVQQLWKLKLSWDESLPVEYHTAWEQFRNDISKMSNIRIPRRVTVSNGSKYDLHIFCDASQVAYGACAYIRTVTENNMITSRLLIAKSRVCPVKAITIPRLELCAALLAAKLMTIIRQSLHEVLPLTKITLWSDSSIILSWIKNNKPSDTWKIFVANRVEEIRELTPTNSWRHVPGSDNPADHISRGLNVSEIIDCRQWWSGPIWFTLPENEWPISLTLKVEDEMSERRKKITVLQVNVDYAIDFIELLERFSKLERLYRATAYMFRGVTLKKNRVQGEVIAEEIHKSSMFWIKIIQKSSFSVEMAQLQDQSFSKGNSRIQSLTPFIDSEGILRVGGRLQNSNETYDTRHPILLPAESHLSLLIVQHEHRRLIHAGPQQLIASLRRTYWILGIRRLAQKIIFKCDPCYRWKVQCSQQLMGSLPANRVNPLAVFNTCGVDYAGPFKMRYGPQRSKQIFKAYIAIFVCYATKAVHLEWVDDLTTEAFLATLRCFVARRGSPLKIYSDNGRNFVGAATQLKHFLTSPELKQILSPCTANLGISWSFIPPHSPHMGGLWEAGVKSMKFHLRRSLGETILSQREANTLLAQIEAVLNSRPLVAASNDPNDLESLTPGHFIIGRPLTAIHEPNYTEIKSLKLRWHKIQQLVQQFWKHWQTEYLQSLQKRNKWTKVEHNIQPKDLVLIREDYEPPLIWKKGRVIEVHQGSDGLTRVATIKTIDGEVKRPIHKLSLMPNQETVH